jgi:hypothetical protein
VKEKPLIWDQAKNNWNEKNLHKLMYTKYYQYLKKEFATHSFGPLFDEKLAFDAYNGLAFSDQKEIAK